MSFSAVDSGSNFAAPKPKPPSSGGSGGGIFGGIAGAVADAVKPVAQAVDAGTYKPPTTPINFNPAGNYDPNPVIPPYTPGPIGASDGGAEAYSGAPDISGLGQQTQPYLPQPAPTLDINSLLQKALANLGFSNIDSALSKARNQLITRFGDANLANLAGFGLDPQAAAFAQQNYLSGNADLARLDKSRDQNKQAVINRLASHGILFSGDLGHGLSQAESQYGNQRYDLTQSYLQQLQALLDNSLQQKQSLRSNVVNALLSAYGSQIQNPEQLIGLYGS